MLIIRQAAGESRAVALQRGLWQCLGTLGRCAGAGTNILRVQSTGNNSCGPYRFEFLRKRGARGEGKGKKGNLKNILKERGKEEKLGERGIKTREKPKAYLAAGRGGRDRSLLSAHRCLRRQWISRCITSRVIQNGAGSKQASLCPGWLIKE